MPTFTTTKTDPSVCGVTDGTIALNDLLNNTSYTVSYTFNGANVSNVLLSNGTGTINLSGLSAGSYSNMVVLLNGCSTTPPVSVTLTDPAAPTVDPVANINVCPNGTVTSINFTGTGSPIFSWTNDNPSIGLAASGTGNIAAFTANNVSTEQVAHIVVTPNNGSCIGTAIAFDITVNKPTLVEPLDVSVCASGTVNAVVFNGSIGATFNWTNDNINTGLTASGTGTIGSFTAANVATTEISTITVTPIVSGCAGDAQTFTLTVDPSPTVTVPANLTVCAETMVNALTFSGSVGAIFHWTNDNSATGLATSGTGDIATFAAATLTTTTVSTITVTPVLNGCTGTPQVFTLTVRPIPEVTTPTNVVVCTGSTAVVSAFSGTSGAAFSWVNDNTNTGLLASNMGNIANFTTANTLTQQVSIVTVTPVLNGCSGVPKPFTLTVNPLPVFTISSTNPTTCGGVDGAMTLTGLQNNTTYTVSYTINSITTTSSFTSNSAGVILISGLGSGGYSGVITDLNGCASVAQSATLTDPTPPSVSQPIGKVACGGGAVVGTTFVGTAGAIFNWTNDNTAVGLGASGQGNISAFLVANVATNQLATVTITPIKNGCIGATQSFTILVRANPNVNSVTPLSYCSTDAVSAIAFTSTPVGATFNWTNNNTATGLAASNAGTIAPFTAAVVTTLQRSIITVVPTLAGCVGAPSAVVLDINPFVSAGTAVATPPVCLSGGGLTIIDLSSKLTGVTATGVWTDVSTVSAGIRFSSADATLDPNGLPVGIYTFRYTVAGVAPCPNDAEEVTIIIDMCCPPIICLPATVVRSN